jgi:type II secretory pathway pseudopilin PulG
MIGLLVAVLVLLALGAWLIPRIAARHHKAGATAPTPYERGEAVACGAYMSQIDEAIMMYKQDNGKNPPDLASLQRYGVTPEMLNAPDCTYQYNPTNGHVSAQAAGFAVPGSTAQPAATASPTTSSPMGSAPAPQSPPQQNNTTSVSGGGITVKVPTSDGSAGGGDTNGN